MHHDAYYIGNLKISACLKLFFSKAIPAKTHYFGFSAVIHVEQKGCLVNSSTSALVT